jgi:AI-2 transport protein TqsA
MREMPSAGAHSSQSDDADVRDDLMSGSMRLLLGAACIVVILWGIKAASGVLSLILLGFLLAYSALPFVKWIMCQFHLRKIVALALAGGLLGTLQAVLAVLLYKNAVSVKQKLPIYEEHGRDLYQHVEVFLRAHSIDIARLSATNLSASNEIVRFSHLILPQAGSLLSDGLVVILLGWILLAMIAEDTQSSNARPILTQVQNDVGHYVAVYARTGVLTALANMVLLAAFGVDFPLAWCVLYFFLNFIPSIGFVLALVPPGCLALLMLGWKKALLVVGGLVLTQLVSKYAITPMFLRKKAVKVSSIEKTISLLWWVFLLGPVGGILAIPLTLTMKRFFPEFFIIERSYAVAPPG